MNVAKAEVSRSADLARAYVTHRATHQIKPAAKHLWPTATKSAFYANFYANFYAVDEARGAMIG